MPRRGGTPGAYPERVATPNRPRTLATARLALRATQPSHAGGLFEATRDSLDELAPWLPWAVSASRSTSLAFARSVAQKWEADRAWGFTIFFRDEVAGHVELRRLPGPDAGELGYWLRSDLAGRGLMSEAVGEVVRFGFEEIGLERIQLLAGVHNLASRRVAEKLGFERERLVRDGSRGTRGPYDVYVYRLLQSDPRPGSASA